MGMHRCRKGLVCLGKRGAGSGRFLGRRRWGARKHQLWRCQGAGGKVVQPQQGASSGLCFSHEIEKWRERKLAMHRETET